MSRTRPAAIVTGSSDGIGKAIAMRLLAEGYSVVINYSHDDGRAKQTLEDCRQIDDHVFLVKADVSIADQAQSLVNRAVREFGHLEVLVNNAARVADKPILEMSEHEWDVVVDVAMKGAFLCSQAAARQMNLQDNDGVILNIGASTGISARRDGINTCASKAGLMIMTQCMALELSPKIRVNTIVPGLIVTAETESRFRLGDPDVLKSRQSAVPLRRLGRPEDVASAVMLMLAADAGFITGQKIFVNGGQYMS
jgi:3-oxoacyl-[acyl-carrier protein] reductase